MKQTSDRIVTSDRVVHICMEDGDGVDRVVDSWVEVGDVDTQSEIGDAVVVDKTNGRKQRCDRIEEVAENT